MPAGPGRNRPRVRRRVILMRKMAFVVVLSLLPRAGAAQAAGVPNDSVLAAITARGRLLAAYDRAAWHATDALMALHPDLHTANTMLAVRQPDGHWVVHFARLTPARDTLLDIYVATEATRPDTFVARRLPHPSPLPEAELREARALHTAMSDFGTPSRPYNSYVLPRAGGGYWVYFLPAQTDPRAFPFGADVRYEVSPDGNEILAKHRMHRALLNQALPDSAVSGVHTVVTSDLPQDSDVFLVLARRPRRPELVVTEHYLYEIRTDGSITWRRR